MSKETKKKRKNSCQDAEKTAKAKVVKQVTANPLAGQRSPYFDDRDGVEDKHGRSFFDVPCVDLAYNLLGQFIVRTIGGQRIRGRIVETEAYLGPVDKAAHSYQGKRTPKNESMFMVPGTSYVYNIYGMYCCINISSQGDGAAVLIRALEPIDGMDLMQQGRNAKTDTNRKLLKEKDLTNGPSKLCQALHIKKNDFDKVDLTTSDVIWLEKGDGVDSQAVVSCPRINIGYAGDWKDKPLRFYVLGNSCVSVRDKNAESALIAKDV